MKFLIKFFILIASLAFAPISTLSAKSFSPLGSIGKIALDHFKKNKKKIKKHRYAVPTALCNATQAKPASATTIHAPLAPTTIAISEVQPKMETPAISLIEKSTAGQEQILDTSAFWENPIDESGLTVPTRTGKAFFAKAVSEELQKQDAVRNVSSIIEPVESCVGTSVIESMPACDMSLSDYEGYCEDAAASYLNQEPLIEWSSAADPFASASPVTLVSNIKEALYNHRFAIGSTIAVAAFIAGGYYWYKTYYSAEQKS